MNPFYPRFALRLLPRMLGIAAVGAVVGGVYGIVNDQVTYSISPEYFTRLKFQQFAYANFGFPTRVYVAEIGFLASGAVGFFATWFLARIAVPAWPTQVAFRRCLIGFAIIFASAFAAAIVGCVFGLYHSSDYSNWQEVGFVLGVVDLPAFVRVAYIHNAGHLGGLIGLIAAIAFLLRLKRRERNAALAGAATGSENLK
jgi:hypothetical protein